MQKIFGVISLAVGVILIFWGYNMSQAVGSKVNNMFATPGSPGDKPMLLYDSVWRRPRPSGRRSARLEAALKASVSHGAIQPTTSPCYSGGLRLGGDI